MSEIAKQKFPRASVTGPGSSAKLSADRISDSRFTKIQSSALYRLPSKKQTHVPLDSRFAHMLRDESFNSRAKVDRYGRRLNARKGKNELERLYRTGEHNYKDARNSEGKDGRLSVDDDSEIQKELNWVNKTYDPARDGGFSESSSDESSSEEDGNEIENDEPKFLETAADHIPAGQVSSRIAVVNLDWDNIRATDLMACFSSFVPANGRILKVSIYQSEFGRERMGREEIKGPPREIFGKRNKVDDSESDDAADEEDVNEDESERIRKALVEEDMGEEFDSANLRRYQLERLRYFYAVLTCSSHDCAEQIYNALDGTEYLSTANFFDLRFVSEDMDFSENKPREECDKIPSNYRPNEFVTDALQHSKVKLTWDADDIVRKEVQRKAFSGSRADIDENDLKAYLASDNSEDEGVEDVESIDKAEYRDRAPLSNRKLSKKDSERQRVRALLGLSVEPPSRESRGGDDAPVGEMQITFSSGLSGSKNGSVFQNEPEAEETTVQRYVRKEKERKANRKKKMKAIREGEADENISINMEAQEQFKGKEGEAADRGFEDPFFTKSTDDNAAQVTARKEAKRIKRAERTADEARSAAQRAELELLMVNQNDGAEEVAHFDMTEIEKAEKAARKKKRRGKISAQEKEALAAKERDNFAMNVQDPRFQAVHERSEFAIDPYHPRYKGTLGMQSLLEETRRKRSRGGATDAGELKKARKKQKADDRQGTADIENLVGRLKTNPGRDTVSNVKP